MSCVYQYWHISSLMCACKSLAGSQHKALVIWHTALTLSTVIKCVHASYSSTCNAITTEVKKCNLPLTDECLLLGKHPWHYPSIHFLIIRFSEAALRWQQLSRVLQASPATSQPWDLLWCLWPVGYASKGTSKGRCPRSILIRWTTSIGFFRTKGAAPLLRAPSRCLSSSPHLSS